MQYVPKEENKEEALREHQHREDNLKLDKEKVAKKKRGVIIIALILFSIIAAVVTYGLLSPGRYDRFAKCLTEKGAVMYGEDWCQYTNAQKNMFGKSFKYIHYEVNENLNKRPTWVVNGKNYETVQSFERLAALTGCEL
tara:strand:- start:2023 stop:2439 length:417 start_codon:yes stop_codon:yes gene_type:complete